MSVAIYNVIASDVDFVWEEAYWKVPDSIVHGSIEEFQDKGLNLTYHNQKEDFTSFLSDPDFESSAAGWTIVGGNEIAATAATYGYSGTSFIESWVAAPSTLSDRSWSQTIEVPNGVYTIKSMAHAVLQSDTSVVPSGVAIYANKDWVAVTTTQTNPPAEYSLVTVVTDGKLTVGYRITSCNVNWAAWDNVRVRYHMPAKLTISLPVEHYKGMYIELMDESNVLLSRYLITDKSSLTFGLLTGNVYNVYLRNTTGAVLGFIEGVVLTDEDTTVTFDSLLQPQSIAVNVYTPDGTDVTGSAIVTWYDADGNYLCKDAVLSGQVENTEVKYSVKLSKELAMQYKQPEQTTYMVKPSGNEIKVVLEPFASVEVMGIVRDSVTGIPVRDAMVTFSQKLNGEYAHITRAETDSKGAFKATLYDVPTEVTVAAADYISYTMSLDTLTEPTALGEILMKPISGVVVSTGFTYRTSVAEGETPDILDWYSDYANVKYGILNKTTGLPVSNVSVQYPQLVLLDGVSAGDELLLTVVSRTNSFEPTQTAVVVDSTLRCDATFDIVELGGIEASYTTTGNSAVVGILYNEIGEMVQKRSYTSGSLTIDNLRDGSYTLVTMGSSDYFNAIYNLAQLSAVGLVEGTDYVKHTVKVESGVVSVVEMESVPTFDESKLYYTGGDTRFTVNKTSATAGNYLTLTGKIDFKEEYASKVSDVSMVIDLPESAVFVDNSVMVGAAIAPYTLEGNRLTISLPNNYTERVRFCIIPTESGSYAPTAFAQFTVDGKEVLQPIGSAHYTIKDLSIEVPGISAKTTIPVSGTAIGQSTIQIYDDDVLIGETTSLANGVWSTTCELHEPYNLSTHLIHAKVTTQLGLELTSETKECMYDMNYVQVSKVTMINVAHPANSLTPCEYVTVFDFLHPAKSIPDYWYWPDYPEFTFLIEFTDNDTTKVSNVVLWVETCNGNQIPLNAEYDENKGLWVASGNFGSWSNYDIPANVSLDFDCRTEILGDANRVLDIISTCDAELGDDIFLNDLIETIISSSADENSFNNIFSYLGIEGSISSSIPEDISNFVDSILVPEEHPEYKYNDGILSYIDENGNDVNISILYEKCDSMPDAELSEFTQTALTDGTIMYIYSDGDFVKLYYKDTFVILGVQQFPGISTKRIISRISGDEFFTKWNQAKTTIEGLKDIRKANQTISKLTSHLSFGLSGKEAKLRTCSEIKLAYIQERLSPQQLEQLDLKKLDDCLAKLPKEISQIKEVLGRLRSLFKVIEVASIINDINYAIDSRREWNEIIDNINSIDCPNMDVLAAKARDYRDRAARGYNANITTNVTSCIGIDKMLAFLGTIGIASSLGAEISMATVAQIAGVVSWAVTDFSIIQGGYTQIKDIEWKTEIMNKIPALRCDKNCGEPGMPPCPDPNPNNPDDPRPNNPNPNNNNGGEHKSNNPNVGGVHDPSGYVYEGVSSNRLGGVMASCYYKETVEDIYGDQHENVVLWDAEQYAQENPLFTDANGMYRWDVPKGLWQVKFEKEGYETTYSEWLPVPPPQLEVNIPMVQNKQPEVAGVHAYKDGVEIEFDKYMQPATLNTDNIFVIQNGEKVAGKVTLLNEEVAYEGQSETYASKVRFVFDQAITAKEITLTVVNSVKSYAGLQMQDTYIQTLAIEQEVESIVADSLVSMYYGGEQTLTVKVIPAAAAAGKTLVVTSSSPTILGVDTDSIVLDDSGEAVLTVSGELPGMGAISYSLVGYDYRASTLVEVVYDNTKMTANPTASIASGTTVAKGTEVTLSCSTEGAAIYYTLDGSCPCDDTAILYDGTPIVINENSELRIMAMAEGMYESDVVVYNYYVEGVSVEDVVLPLGIEPTIVTDGFRVQGIETEYTVSVYGVGGELVLQRERVKNNAFINIAHVPEGMYIVVVSKDDDTYKQRILKVE